MQRSKYRAGHVTVFAHDDSGRDRETALIFLIGVKSSIFLYGFNNGNIRLITPQLRLNCTDEHLFLMPKKGQKSLTLLKSVELHVSFFCCSRGILYTFGFKWLF